MKRQLPSDHKKLCKANTPRTKSFLLPQREGKSWQGPSEVIGPTQSKAWRSASTALLSHCRGQPRSPSWLTPPEETPSEVPRGPGGAAVGEAARTAQPQPLLSCCATGQLYCWPAGTGSTSAAPLVGPRHRHCLGSTSTAQSEI